MPVVQFSLPEVMYERALSQGKPYNLSINRLGKALFLLWMQKQVVASPRDVLRVLKEHDEAKPVVPRLFGEEDDG